MATGKLVVESSPKLEHLLGVTRARSIPDSEVLDALATAQEKSTTSNDIEDQSEVIDLLRMLTHPMDPKLDGNILQAMEPTRVLGIHLGFPMGVERCPFGRDTVGISALETDPEVLVDRSFAEWKTAQTKRRTVVVFKLSRPVLIYRDITWADSPNLLPDGTPREFHGRHYIESATVTALHDKGTYSLTTRPDSQGFIKPHLDNREKMDETDQFIDYVRKHRRDRRAIQQPIDLLA